MGLVKTRYRLWVPITLLILQDNSLYISQLSVDGTDKVPKIVPVVLPNLI